MTFTTAFTVCAHTQKPAEYREQGLGFSFSGLTITFKLKGARGPLAQTLHLAQGTEGSALRASTVRMTAAHLNMTPPQISHVTCPFSLGGETLGARSKFCFLEHQVYTHSSKNECC